jgi:hypothetical protein
LGTTTAARACRLAAAQLPHDELQEQQRGFGGLFVFGEIALDALLLLAAEGRVGEDHVHALAFADVGELEAEGVAGIDLRASRPCSSRFIWQSRYGSDFGSQPKRIFPARRCGRPRF